MRLGCGRFTLLLSGALALGLNGCSLLDNSEKMSAFGAAPMVHEIEDGMTEAQVLSLGGAPDSIVMRSDTPGSCYNYTLNRHGQSTPWHVGFRPNGTVDEYDFTPCEPAERQAGR